MEAAGLDPVYNACSENGIAWRKQKAEKDDKSFLPIWTPLHQAITLGGLAATDASSLMSGRGLTAEQKLNNSNQLHQKDKPNEAAQKESKSTLHTKRKAHLAPREKQNRQFRHTDNNLASISTGNEREPLRIWTVQEAIC